MNCLNFLGNTLLLFVLVKRIDVSKNVDKIINLNVERTKSSKVKVIFLLPHVLQDHCLYAVLYCKQL